MSSSNTMSYDELLDELVPPELLKHKQKNWEWYFKCWDSTGNVHFTNKFHVMDSSMSNKEMNH